MIKDIIIETPKSYGLFHLGSIIILGIVIFLSIKFLKNPSRKTVNIVMLVSGIIMILLEVFKELSFVVTFNEELQIYEYSWYAFPFQFCSTAMYVMVLVPLFKEGKIRQALLAFLASYSIFGGLTVYAYPEQVFVSHLGVCIQTMVHHGLQIAVGVWLLASGVVKINYKSLINGSYVFFVLFAIAFLMNVSFYNLHICDGHAFNMFYIGPYYECTLPLVSMFYPKEFNIIGYILFLLLYIVGFIAASGVILLIAYGIQKLVMKLKNNKGDLV